jgi:outer membrane immunogenic protein
VKKSILCTSVFLMLACAGAAADELPTRPSYYVTGPTPSLPWTGFYIGGVGGYGWANSAVQFGGNDAASAAGTCGGAGRPAGQCISGTGFTLNGALAGGQVGYDWQITSLWLVGFAADYQWSGFSEVGTSPTFRLGGVGTTEAIANETVDSFGTVRVRMGTTPVNSVLLYGTAGLAYGHVKTNLTIPNPVTAGTSSLSTGGYSYSCSAGGPACFAGSTAENELGWTIGGGGEMRLTNHISLQTEVLYVQFDAPDPTATAQRSVVGTTPSSMAATFTPVRQVVWRAAVNFRF